MENNRITDVCTRAIKVYGQNYQEMVLIEELSELIIACNSMVDADVDLTTTLDLYENLYEEIGDVCICLEYLYIGRDLRDVVETEMSSVRDNVDLLCEDKDDSGIFSYISNHAACIIQYIIKIKRLENPSKMNELIHHVAVLRCLFEILFDLPEYANLNRDVLMSIEAKINRLEVRMDNYEELKNMVRNDQNVTKID